MVTIVVFEFFEQHLRSVVEKVDAAVVERGQDPWAVLVKGQPFNTFALGLKLCLHHLC